MIESTESGVVEYVVTFSRDEGDDQLRYVRAASQWRRPLVHILRQAYYMVEQDHDGERTRWDSYAPMCSWYGNGSYNEADVFDTPPDGVSVCQRCADRLAFEAQRERQRQAPDPRAYDERTGTVLDLAHTDAKVARGDAA
jgi:hypothetical protein